MCWWGGSACHNSQKACHSCTSIIILDVTDRVKAVEVQACEAVAVAARPGNGANEEMQGTVQLLHTQGKTLTQIHRDKVTGYSERVMNREPVSMWCTASQNGWINLTGELQAWRPRTSTLGDIHCVEGLIHEDRCVKIFEIVAQLKISTTRLHEVVHDAVGVCALCPKELQWTPHTNA
jgi:hypothetical protein